MAEILLFHHALGLTEGCRALADELRAAGHVVHVPDLYEGKTFTELDDGVGHANAIGFGTVIERGRAVAEDLPNGIVYAGISLGILPAQMLTQTRSGAKGALFLHGSIPLEEFGGEWPDGVPLQIHTMTDDDWGDADVARELEATIESAELFLYPGDRHLFSDPSVADYDKRAATQLMQRVLTFLERIDES